MKIFIPILFFVVNMLSFGGIAHATGNCTTLSNSTGYYGGFEADPNFSSTTASTDYSLGLPPNGSYEIVGNTSNGSGGGYLPLGPHSGNCLMLVHTRSVNNDRIWYKTVSVTPGTTYEFCAWIANVKTDPTNGFLINLNVNGTAIASQTTGYGWSQVCGSYTAPSGVTSITLSITDPDAHTGPSHFLALDDICFTSVTPTVGSLGDFVWNDRNGNGIQEPGEPGIAGVTVTLTYPNNQTVTTTTNASGFYSFSNLPAGTTYKVSFATPQFFISTPANQGGDDTKDSDPINGMVSNITIVAGQANLTVDAGFQTTILCLGDLVWNDTNNNGIKDTNEVGIAGLTVKLYRDANGDNIPDGAAIATTTTDANGNYLFVNMTPGNYIVGVTLPSGSVASATTATSATPNNDINNDNNGVNTVGGELRSNFITLTSEGEPTNDGDGTDGNLSLDFGLRQVNQTFTLGNQVWYDTNNDGLFNNAENGIIGLTVNLYVDANNDNIPDGTAIATTTTSQTGTYQFSGLASGRYIVGAVAPSGYVRSAVGTTDINTDNQNDGVNTFGTEVRTNGFTLNASSTKIDVGLLPDCGCTTSSSNLLVNGSFENGTTGWTAVNGTVTSGTGYVACGTKNGFNNWGSGISRVYQDVAFAAGTAVTFTGFAGTHTAGISCSPKLSLLFLNSSNGVISQSDVVVTRDVDKNFNQLEQYTITATAPAGTVKVRVQSSITCDYMKLDALCLTAQAPANLNLGNLVWYDQNNNGTRDAGEPGIAGAIVKLYADANGDNIADGAAIATTTTDANGLYTFTGLTPGNYIAGVTLPAGYAAGNVSSATPNNDVDNDNNGSNTSVSGEVRSNFITLSAGGEPTTDGDGANGNLTLDFGLKGTGSIGDFVFNDLNGNGIQDNGEPGLPGVTVTLTYPVGNTVTTTTNANGAYTFSNLAPGTTYSVAFSSPSGFVASPAKQGGDDTKDSDPVNGVVNNVTVLAGVANTNIDAGFQSNQLNLGSTVWNDLNNNGTLDAGEPGIAGATVKLYADVNGDNIADGAAIATTTTDANGLYSFTGLTPGNYIVGVTLPTGFIAASIASPTPNNDVDNDNNGSNTSIAGEVRSNFITLTTGGEPTNDGDGANGNLTLDFGLLSTATGSISDFVWDDLNGNGIQDNGEPGIKGVIVTLTYPNNTTATFTTDANGNYSFTNLPAGTYTVSFTTPTYYTPTFTKVGSNTAIDSDPNNGSASVTLLPGQNNTSVDAGFIWDIDTDDDGITNIVEGNGYDGLRDCDGDGIPNYRDLTPGCPTPVGNDPFGNPYKPLLFTDCNGDGVNDFFDFDRDGIIDQLDLDSDNDGIVDAVEARDPRLVDANNNGIVDGADDDRDGLLNSADATPNAYGGPGFTAEDLDRDGKPNFKDLDSDGDGISDLTEARGFLDSDGIADGNDADNDGIRSSADNITGRGGAGITPLDNDSDGKPNPYDIDSDNDGITDNVEGQPTCSYKAPLGVDTDGDGLDDAYDTFNNICIIRAPGITPFDKDGDGNPDMYDLDTDNDGALDVNEGSGISGNFVTNFNDTDGDGLIDQFDIFNINTATSLFTNNVTHSNMGNNGTFDGPIPAGSKAQLPQGAPGDCSSGTDRDWRNISVLPVNLTSFSGRLNNTVTDLDWTVAGQLNLKYYGIERSTNGINFTAIAQVKPNASSANNIRYTYTDNVNGINAPVVYYRLAMVDVNGATKYSNILSFKLNNKGGLSIGLYPNPAASYVTIKLNAVKDGPAAVRITDGYGKIIRIINTNIRSGANVITVNDVAGLPQGTYNIQVLVNGQLLNQKLVIAR